MSFMKRRHFLQFAGSTLAALGINQWEVYQQGDLYAQVLAQGTPRKLALLVGINAYPESSQFSTLRGCLTDVELQRQLLIHRFGFNPADILTLTDAKATRQNILTAFDEHLIRQAKAGDVVVFHFSGHGSQVVDPDRDFPDGLNSTFVPVDSVLPSGFPAQGGTVQDIMGHTLFLLMSALKTENVSVILDSCHSGGGTRGNLRVRSRAGGAQLQASSAEFEYQKQWLSKLNLSPEEFVRQRRAGVAKGVVIASAKRDQLAADAPFSDFYAGAFTYLMTQYLWQATSDVTFSSAIPNVARSTTQTSSSSQEPMYEVKPGSQDDRQLIYFVPQRTIPAEAVITKVNGNQAELWLGGLAPQSLAAFETNAILTADTRDRQQVQVKLESRDGLIGRGTLLSNAKPGTLLQEQVRGIPTNLTLKIGLDPSLGQDAAQAKQALQAIKRIEAVPLQTEEVDYILGRITSTSPRAKNAPINSLGLFSPGLDPIPGSFGMAGEKITAGVDRLQAKLKALLAARLVKLMLNPNSSRLDVSVSMYPQGKENQLVASTFTMRGATKPNPTPPSNRPQALPLGVPIQFQITNREARDLYFSVLVIDSTGEMAVVFPNQWTASSEVMQVSAGKTVLIPNPAKDSFRLVTQEPKGATEVLIVASSKPLGKALKALQGIASRGGQSRGPVVLSEPIAVVGDLLEDLSSNTRGSSTTVNRGTTHSIDATQLAALSITFDIV
jgi:hypothetical protein